MADGSTHVLQEMNNLQNTVEAVGESMKIMFENVQNVEKNRMQLDGCVKDLNTNVNKLVSDVSRFKTK